VVVGSFFTLSVLMGLWAAGRQHGTAVDDKGAPHASRGPVTAAKSSTQAEQNGTAAARGPGPAAAVTASPGPAAPITILQRPNDVGDLKAQGELFVQAAVERRRRSQRQPVRAKQPLIPEPDQIDQADSLLEFLLERRAQIEEQLKDDYVQINHEIAAVASRSGKADVCEQAIDKILQVAPDDARALASKGLLLKQRGQLDEAADRFARALELSQADGDRRIEALACRQLALIHRQRGQLDQAEQMHLRALEIHEQLGTKRDQAVDYGHLGLVYKMRQDLAKAERMYLQALKIDRELDDRQAIAADYCNLGVIYKMRGNLVDAEQMYRNALRIDQQLDRKEGIAADYCNLGVVFLARGDLDEAENMYRKALAIDEQLGRDEGMAADYCNLGVVCVMRGRLEQAEKHWTKARDIFERLSMPQSVEKLDNALARLRASVAGATTRPGPQDKSIIPRATPGP